MLTFSVVVNTWNAAAFITDSLRSISAQSFRDFEVIVLDDGSTDDTEQLVNEWRTRLPALKYIRQDHLGLPEARNRAIALAAGTYIAFLDADDLWMPDYLQRVFEVIRAVRDVDVICADGWRVSSSERVISSFFPKALPPLHGSIRDARQLFSLFRYASPSATVVARMAFKKVGGYDARFPITNDWHWLIRAAQAESIFYRIDEPLAIYRLHACNLTLGRDHVLDEWSVIYVSLLQDSHQFPQSRILARSVTRGLAAVMVSEMAPRRSRQILSTLRDRLEPDPFLTLLELMTYVGGHGLLRKLRSLRHMMVARPTLASMNGTAAAILKNGLD